MTNIGQTRSSHWLALVAGTWIVALVVSGVAAFDRLIWLLEVTPVLIALPVLLFTGSRFPLSGLVYALILAHGLILILGGTYTYARVPLGLWVEQWLALSRNPYDKLGHFAQGFVPAMIAREVLLRRFGLPRGRLVAFLAISICGLITASYEIIEWWVSVAAGATTEDFLGTQGDPWDTQSDMLFAIIGASIAMLLLPNAHDRSMARLP